ncbi:MAG: tyrosine-type recombinase/integrase [Thermoleophilia bacterium]|nr:tyrosine-type recombinase/integrase [Thermoleophilia bacterium]
MTSATTDPFYASRLLIAEFVGQADVTAATRTKYRAHLGELLAWLNHPNTSRREAGLLQIADVSPADLHRYMAYLRGGDRFAAIEHHRVRGELSPSARKNILSSIHSFYRYLSAVRVIVVDPSALIKPPRVQHRPGLALTADEVRRILDAHGTPRERIQAYLLTYTAARTDEIRRLRWQDIDFAKATITISGKYDKIRHIDIHPRLMTELRRWYIWQDEEANRNAAIRAAKAHSEQDYVLLTSTGQPVPTGLIARQLKNRAARAGVHVRENGGRDNRSAVSPHALRRTFATLLLDQGHHIDAIADVLGHASVDTTRRHYAFASTARRRDTIHAYNV